MVGGAHSYTRESRLPLIMLLLCVSVPELLEHAGTAGPRLSARAGLLRFKPGAPGAGGGAGPVPERADRARRRQPRDLSSSSWTPRVGGPLAAVPLPLPRGGLQSLGALRLHAHQSHLGGPRCPCPLHPRPPPQTPGSLRGGISKVT